MKIHSLSAMCTRVVMIHVLYNTKPLSLLSHDEFVKKNKRKGETRKTREIESAVMYGAFLLDTVESFDYHYLQCYWTVNFFLNGRIEIFNNQRAIFFFLSFFHSFSVLHYIQVRRV